MSAQRKIDWSSMWKKEDWWALWIGLLIFILALPTAFPLVPWKGTGTVVGPTERIWILGWAQK